MIVLAVAAFAAAFFGAAGWAGTIAADALCANRTPFDDGPQPVAYAPWHIAAAAACVGAGVALHGAAGVHLLLPAFVTFALAGCTAADLRCGILPDALTLGPLAVVVAAGAAAHDTSPALGAFALFVPFAFGAVLSRGRGMGWGDVKLAALGGALLGARDATLAFLLAALAAYVIARRTGGVRRPVAFGPYLAASIAATLATVRTL